MIMKQNPISRNHVINPIGRKVVVTLAMKLIGHRVVVTLAMGRKLAVVIGHLVILIGH